MLSSFENNWLRGIHISISNFAWEIRMLGKSSARFLILAIAIINVSCTVALSQENAGVTGDEATGYHMRVVSRSTQAVDYRHLGSTKVDLRGTDLMPKIKGDAKVEGKPNGVKLDVHLEHLGSPHDFGLAYLTYVLWAITPEGHVHNLGELVLHDGKSSLQTTSELQAFGLIVTAEPDFAVAQPSDVVVAQNIVHHNTGGGVEPIDVKFELIPRDSYNAQVQPLDEPMFGIDRTLPLDLLEARNAVRIARDAHADRYAPDTFQKAKDLLERANDYYNRKQGRGPIGTVARESVQTAEAARVITIKREQEEDAAAARKAQEERTAEAQAEALRRQAEAEQAQAQAAQAQAQAEAASRERQAAEQARQQAELARQQAAQQAQQAEQARQQAEQAQQQAEQARQQAENEKEQMRARMLQQLNQVLETKDTARGLIVSMPDVLFSIAKADLKETARERLAKVAGILIAYPDIHVEVDGYTDSTGSLEFNEHLSQERADSVLNYLVQQGVNAGTITTRGFGPNDPIASNDTAAGRQQNRRVELVVSGASIGQGTNAPN